jgi:hypothetical protein
MGSKRIPLLGLVPALFGLLLLSARMPAVLTSALPAGNAPTASPTPTRTPSPPAKCPPPTGKKAVISADIASGDLKDPDPAPLLDYLNAAGSAEGLKTALSAEFNPDGVKVFLADVTGDGVLEAAVSISRADYYQAHVLVLGCQGGRWVSLLAKTYVHQGVDAGLGRDGLQAVRDVNGDGIAEIIYSFSPNIGNHGYGVTEYSIIEWQGQSFVPLLPPADAWPDGQRPVISVFNAAKLLIRPHGDGSDELAFNLPALKYTYYGGSEPERNVEEVYAWDGKLFTRFCKRYTQPEKYYADAAMDGDNETTCRQYERAMRAYQGAIYSNDLLPWVNLQTMSYGKCCAGGWEATPTSSLSAERPMLSAYARYRIILLHATQNQIAEAQTDYTVLQKLFPLGVPGSLFAGLASAFWEAYSPADNVAAGCQRAIEYATTHAEIAAFFAQYMFWSETASPAFTLNEDIRQICPFN